MVWVGLLNSGRVAVAGPCHPPARRLSAVQLFPKREKRAQYLAVIDKIAVLFVRVRIITALLVLRSVLRPLIFGNSHVRFHGSKNHTLDGQGAQKLQKLSTETLWLWDRSRFAESCGHHRGYSN